ncbi:MAG: endonuclease domain-containing protein [Phenylobacterium sp.]
MAASPEAGEMASRLRQALTLPEGLLWKALKARRQGGLHFRRQHPLGPYVLDFCCSQARLGVEEDGYSHGAADRPERDAARDEWLLEQGVETLRLRAGLVLEDLDAALSMIRTAARARLGEVD